MELEAWTISSEVEKKKLAVIAARSLPEQVDGIRLRSRVLREITLTELNKDTGMEKLFEWLMGYCIDGHISCRLKIEFGTLGPPVIKPV